MKFLSVLQLLLGWGSIMLTSLFSLFHVTGECSRFLHRGFSSGRVWNLYRTHPLSRLPTSPSQCDNLQIRPQRWKKQIEWIPHVLELENRPACTTFEPWFGICEQLIESHRTRAPFHSKGPRDGVSGVYWGGLSDNCHAIVTQMYLPNAFCQV